jgi:hypothetical protein
LNIVGIHPKACADFIKGCAKTIRPLEHAEVGLNQTRRPEWLKLTFVVGKNSIIRLLGFDE